VDVKKILTGWVVLIVISGCFCGDGRGPALDNLGAPPTDGGVLNGSCDGTTDTLPACVRDGDYLFYTCSEGRTEPTWVECTEGEVCNGLRDTTPALCVDPDDILYESGSGMEPGSDWWLDEKARQEAEDQGGGSPSCCKVCRSSRACGDSCISPSKSCNVGRGCACNG
jgi:hypothetical protein